MKLSKKILKKILGVTVISGLLIGIIGLNWSGEKKKEGLGIPVKKVPESATGKKVEILRKGDRYRLYRNGKPYYIKGAGGRVQLELLRKCGGNSIRTWTASGLDTLLAKADSLGLTVAVGLDLGRERLGFDYGDALAVAKQKKRIRQIVSTYKDHPAVLFWVLGNEMDLKATNNHLLWPALNDLAISIKKIDPHHPVTTASLPRARSVEAVLKHCPDLDFLSINAFRKIDNVQNVIQEQVPESHRPYLFSEWGVDDTWESKRNTWMHSQELSVKEKYEQLYHRYYNRIMRDSQYCLGSYVFYWGQKQESTPTWFSLFLETGEKTPLVDLMMRIWSGKDPVNEAPFLFDIQINGKDREEAVYLNVGQKYSASVGFSDAEEPDQLSFSWDMLDERNQRRADGGDFEERPPSRRELILWQEGHQIWFRAPNQPGPYRLLVYTIDGQGGGAYANLPFYALDNRLTDN